MLKERLGFNFMTEFTPRLQAIVDKVVSHVHEGTLPPKNVSELINWYESEGREFVHPEHGVGVPVAIHLSHLASERFSDQDLIEYQDFDEPVTDSARIRHAKSVISEALEAYDGEVCPSVCSLEIQATSGITAVLGWLSPLGFWGGERLEFRGAFCDEESFYRNLSDSSYILEKDIHKIGDTEILNLWRNSIPKANQEATPIHDPSLADRTDMDNLFLCDDENWAHLFTQQDKLPIDTYVEAKNKGSFVPKPRSYDVHKSLRTFRRLILTANENGALNFEQITELIDCLVKFIELGDEDIQRSELKKYLYVVMLNKKIAETLDGDMPGLLQRALRETFNRLPITYCNFSRVDMGDLLQAYNEVVGEFIPADAYGFDTDETDDPDWRQKAKDDMKRRFPTLYKLEWGDGS